MSVGTRSTIVCPAGLACLLLCDDAIVSRLLTSL